MENQEEDLVSLKKAADILKLEPATLRKYVQKKIIKGQKIGGRWYFHKSDLKERRTAFPPVNNPVLPPKDRIQKIDNHFDDLAKCAKELADILEEMKDLDRDDTIDEVMEGCAEAGINFDMIEFFSKRITGRLFAHLKQSHFVHGLETLDSWGDLEISKVDDDFIKMIRLEAAARGFEGECDLCETWFKKKSGLKLK